MSTAIERITGFACEVDEEQWRELVKVADEVGVPVSDGDRQNKLQYTIAGCFAGEYMLTFIVIKDHGLDLIPYPDFLAKLKGVEKWELKAGVFIECSKDMLNWETVEYIVYSKKVHICWRQDGVVDSFNYWRPLPNAITRKEAEEKLNARIID